MAALPTPPTASIRSVIAPASSANLGAGFDVFGMALDLVAEVGVGPAPNGATEVGEHHLVRVPFERLGGDGPLWLRTNIPMARGLGFSGAVRVAAAGMGAVIAAGGDGGALNRDRDRILDVSAELEGHGDNAAASAAGGVVAYVDGRIVPFRLGPTLSEAVVLSWIPDVTTKTDQSRKSLPAHVERHAAVANIGRATQFVLAFAHDDPELLSGAADDELHQDWRLSAVPGAAEAIADGVAAGAWCGWLSGSGPTVALMCGADVADRVAAGLPTSGHVKRLAIDRVGLRRG